VVNAKSNLAKQDGTWPEKSFVIDYLVVAGGGAGGTPGGNSAGGGGGGGLRASSGTYTIGSGPAAQEHRVFLHLLCIQELTM
jgi:hypothetical protein